MSTVLKTNDHLRADCENCFGLCCVALPYAKSTDFAFHKDGGTPCRNLQSDYRCGIYKNLRNEGFKGCTVYECFGAGQHVSNVTYEGKSWRNNPETAKEMFDVFPIMQQLHEMLYYVNEALGLEQARPIHNDLKQVFEETELLTKLSPKSILELDVPSHRAIVNELLLRTSEYVRMEVKNDQNQLNQSEIKDLIGKDVSGVNLSGFNFRGALLIAADLRRSDLRMVDFIGADLRDANISGANLTGSIFLTQAQVNAAKGDKNTELPPHLSIPKHWLE
ncbi:pentapeptide repeat-containing protein [Ornithinibacillus salinisoli]|uniref:Pentapeptide repeat-containing protein n=1 Tax=Ornithinibacillus salinisoli TaxID=1848459 RepID=A0ABW4W2G6_9BACI